MSEKYTPSTVIHHKFTIFITFAKNVLIAQFSHRGLHGVFAEFIRDDAVLVFFDIYSPCAVKSARLDAPTTCTGALHHKNTVKALCHLFRYYLKKAKRPLGIKGNPN